MHIASLHISCILKRSGTYTTEHGSVRTASLHASCVLRLENAIIQLVMFIYTPRAGWG